MRKKSKKPYSKSFRKRLFILVNITIFVVIGVCVLLNSLVFKKYYITKKTDLVFRQLDEIEYLLQEDYSETKFRLEMERLCINSNIQAVVYDESRRLVYTSVPQNAFRFRSNPPADVYFEGDSVSIITDSQESDNLNREILRKGNSYLVSLSTLQPLNTQVIELYAVTDNNHFIFLQSSVAPISESVAFSNSFLISIGIVVGLISAIIVTFLSNKLVRPLRRLSDIALRMAKMDFSQKYSGKSFDEVGVLGESMNTMSENLEKTISNLKTANAALVQDIDKKEKIDKQRKEFMSNVSHELKTPISIIEAYAEGLCEMELDEESRTYYCDVILDEARKMNVLIKKLMSLMRIESGSDRLDITRFDITDHISEIIKQKYILLEQNGVSITFSEKEPIFVWADDFLIEEVFLNYLTNAIKYCSGEKRIDVSIEKNNDIVRVSVFNTGERVDDEILENVWKSFYMADKARTRENGGQGLGLSLVSAIMNAHNQKYGAYNTDGGIVFYFELDGKSE